MTDDPAGYSTVLCLAEIAGLVHGFGGAGWSEADFLAFAASLDLRPVIMRQVHSDTVHRLDEVPAGKLEGDALMTNAPGLLLVIRTADCLPVFLVDAKNRAAAAVHCGWRGTEKRILEKAVQAMVRSYGSEPGAMLAALGPCIGSACYEVGPEVRKSFLRAGFPPAVLAEAPGRPGKSLLDLRAANIWLLDGLGFKNDNILDSGSACTHCEPHLLSYRRNPGDSRRMYNFIGFRLGS
ncbi:MAG: peptidoglycan editing factor PgeF [Candidatus Aminicenantes bacterium]|nr:peptidoglycan editing factor PgeF [Candidatus Aminicenantes bacterium]